MHVSHFLTLFHLSIPAVILRTIEAATRNAIAEAPETHYRAIRLQVDPPERVLPQDLINTDHELLRKIVSTLLFLCDEAQELTENAELRLFKPLQMFGQAVPQNEHANAAAGKDVNAGGDEEIDDAFKPGDREKIIGTFLPLLQNVSNYIDRCYILTSNIVQQLASLLRSQEQLYRSTFQNTHVAIVFTALGRLLATLASLDSLIASNDMIGECWGYYKTMISYVRTDVEAFGTDADGLSTFERMLVSIDQTVLIGDIFKGCVEQNFEQYVDEDAQEPISINVRGNGLFFTELVFSLRQQIDIALRVLGTAAELPTHKYDVMSGVCLYVLYRKLLPARNEPDAKLYKYLWEVQKLVPVVVVGDSVLWSPGDFLTKYAFLEIKKPDPVNPAAHRRQYITTYDGQMPARTASLLSQVQAWLVLAESRIQPNLRHDSNTDQALDLRGSILLKGLSLAHRASTLTKQSLVMHTVMQVPLTKGALMDLSRLTEMLKAIEFTLIRKDSAIGELTVHTLRVLYDAIFQTLQPLRRRLETILNSKKSSKETDAANDILCAVSVLENLIRSSDGLSPSRRHALQLLSEIISVTPNMPPKDATRLVQLTKRLVALSAFHEDVKKTCDTSFLYFHTDILKPIIQAIYAKPKQANRLQYIMAAFSDGIKMCEAVRHVYAGPYFMAYRSLLRDSVQVLVVHPLCRDIENNLRVHISSKNLAHMASMNPKEHSLVPLRPFLDSSPIHILGLVVHIHAEVTHYLNTNFYNLTTIALHDWRTYADMRSLAQEKLGIILMDNYLPMGSDDQGLDVLQIMRNIHIFVSRFTYNMNMQQFVEYRPDKSSKHLNTIRIQSIAASIRQHGLGVLNTTVNYTYQFLAQKFHIYSQFLFDDYIGAHLGKEHRWFKKHKHDKEIDNQYPYDRALGFVKDIRKLGIAANGKSFLDQFRILITEIGNALGYVRMVRSASMYYCSEAVQYLPDFNNVINFENAAGAGSNDPGDADAGIAPTTTPGAGLSPETVRAGTNLDSVIETLVNNFGEGSDYFKVLVNVFQQVLLTPEHAHLRNFYLIVPALCISWVEASLTAKDCMYKATRGVVREMYYTDDGFPVGVAYCLAILKQTRKFESLHWVDTVRSKHKEDAAKILAAQTIRDAKEKAKAEKKAAAEKAKKGWFSGLRGKKGQPEEEEEEEDYEDQDAIHTLQTSGKRLEAQRRETEQLFYCLSGAGIFFKRTDVDT